MALVAIRLKVLVGACTISDVAKEACKLSDKWKMPVSFKFNSIECEVFPNMTWDQVVNAFNIDSQGRL